MQYNHFSAKLDVGSQTIWIEDQAPRLVGPDLDLYCLQRAFKINICLESARKNVHFVPELFEGTVCMEVCTLKMYTLGVTCRFTGDLAMTDTTNNIGIEAVIAIYRLINANCFTSLDTGQYFLVSLFRQQIV